MAHPLMMKAIGASKKKSDRIDARKIADMVRCNWLPVCYVAPVEMRELRRLLRYRNLVVRHAVRMKNKIAGLLMEVGEPYTKRRLHGEDYFKELLGNLKETPESVKDLLRLSRGTLVMFESMQKQLLERLLKAPELRERVERLRSIGGVGEVMALTWALEIVDPNRFSSIGQAQSYCGLTEGAEEFGEQGTTRADFQAAQRPFADDPDRNREAGAALEPAVGGGPCQGTRARTPEPGDFGGGAETGGLSAGGGQIGSAIPGARRGRDRGGNRSRDEGSGLGELL